MAGVLFTLSIAELQTKRGVDATLVILMLLLLPQLLRR
jgi:hypothetical protein